MADGMIDTAAQRAATGLDRGARGLVIRVVADVASIGPEETVSAFFYDRFGGLDDYFRGVSEVWGEAEGFRLDQVVNEAAANVEFSFTMGRPKPEANFVRAHTLLLQMPEPDFRLAITEALRAVNRMEDAAARITGICRNRGAPWAFSHPNGFEYVGDEKIEAELIRPALAAVNRPEFVGGVKQEFDSARAELAQGTPTALKQAVHEAGNSVESAMKVVLEAHNVPHGPGDTAAPLFDKLEAAGIVPRHMQNLVLMAMTPRNRRGGHGAGAIPHQVDASEAESIVAGAGGAIAYLATLLP
jgi:hypothetical protein